MNRQLLLEPGQVNQQDESEIEAEILRMEDEAMDELSSRMRKLNIEL
jgi:hypothetical protein